MAQEPQNQPMFNIEKIYVRDASLELPHAPRIFTNATAPQISVDLTNRAYTVEDGIYEVVVKVTVTAKVDEEVAFLVEVDQAGIFQIRNVPQDDMEPILAVACPNILFPYARETVSDLITRAGFPPVLLNPVNFEGLYMQQKQQQVDNGSATQ